MPFDIDKAEALENWAQSQGISPVDLLRTVASVVDRMRGNEELPEESGDSGACAALRTLAGLIDRMHALVKAI